MTKFGTVKQIDLREIWPHEAYDFTTWLASKDGLNLLSQTLGLELDDAVAETNVGAFSVDILAVESGTEKQVVIENQLEDTNHDHLGKLITYAAGTNASYAIWIVKHAREEHQRAIEWLNNNTNINIGFFLIEIAAIQIDDSRPGPIFSIIEKPNDWAKSTKSSNNMTETEKLRLNYWQRYNDLARQNNDFMHEFKPRKPKATQWSNLSIGNSHCHIELLTSIRDNQVGIGFYVPDNKELAKKAIDAADQISQTIGTKGIPFEASKAAGIRFFKNNCYLKNHPERWDEYITWQLETALKLKSELLKLII